MGARVEFEGREASNRRPLLCAFQLRLVSIALRSFPADSKLVGASRLLVALVVSMCYPLQGAPPSQLSPHARLRDRAHPSTDTRTRTHTHTREHISMNTFSSA
eukprot:6205988-Pleurochrysis_carterae.AAC.1